ncbi:unnamed protein product [marine sediment metagenome]|uniref:Uncharacterized protein n=1 Tax=marine sediment metagenome TaxID=412755 RepID=X1EAE2_9ZZZZ
MKRKYFFVILFFILAMFLSGCGKETEMEKKSGLAIVIEKFEEKFDVGDRKMKAFGMIGAEDGFGLIVEGEEIELYKFDPDSDDEKTRENIKSAKTTGTMKMEGFSFPVIYNESIDVALTRYDEHPKRDEIVEVFKSIN